VNSVLPGPASRGARRSAFLRGVRRGAFPAAALLLLAGCFGGDDERPAPKQPEPTAVPAADLRPAATVADGGTLRIGIDSFPATFNPVHTDGVDSSAPDILDPTLGSAIRIGDDGSWTVDPDYARSVEVTDRDPLTVRVELNQQAVWQGGTPITSRDMIQYVAAMQDDDFAAATTSVFDDIDEVRPDGDFAYEVAFDNPNADWPAAVYPTLPAAVTKRAEVFNTAFTRKAPSANGPYRVASIQRRTGTITLERNPRWWGQRPKLDSIVWRIGAADVLAEAYRADELDAAPVTPATAETFADSDDLRASAGADWSQLTINGGTGPLEDADVRRAVMLAVDTEAIVDATSHRYGVLTTAMDSVVLLPHQVGHRAVPGTGRDMAQAQELLAQAGWTRVGDTGPVQRKGTALTLRLPVADTMSGAIERAELIAEDLAEVGITVQVTQVPGSTFFEQVVIPLDFDLTTFTWQTPAFGLSETERLFTPIDSPLNFTGKASGAITDAFDAAVAELDEQKRSARVAKVDEVARAQASILPLAVLPRVMVVASTVVNYGPTSLADLDWTVVGFQPEKPKSD